jgi:hypothetical protein
MHHGPDHANNLNPEHLPPKGGAVEEGNIRVSIMQGGNAVQVEAPDGRTTFLQGKDEIRSVQHSLPFDLVKEFQAGRGIVIRDPGYLN